MRSSVRDVKLRDCHADELGQRDLDAWIRADDLINHLIPRSRDNKIFEGLQSLAFGGWDHGRWETYLSQAWADIRPSYSWRLHSDDSSAENSESEAQGNRSMRLSVMTKEVEVTRKPALNVYPSGLILWVLKRILDGNERKNLCYNTRSLNFLDFGSKFTALHKAGLGQSMSQISDRTRFYTTIKDLQIALSRPNSMDSLWSVRLGPLSLHLDSQRQPVFRAVSVDPALSSATDHVNGFGSDFESDMYNAYLAKKVWKICLLPEIEGDEGELKLARDVRDALTKYEEASQTKDKTNGYLGKFEILVGDDIPACACCGGRR